MRAFKKLKEELSSQKNNSKGANDDISTLNSKLSEKDMENIELKSKLRDLEAELNDTFNKTKDLTTLLQ